ncbi:unnamed protein product [Prunus armeniaca]|uniref:SET domain-containing protein n=1 Tax=Prunus armeniaca TaxID=36596 RepID=A0A6J5WTK0_PRUAR|nr:unnamed protein product [Prunus armeniaca]
MAEASRVLQTTLIPSFHPQHKSPIFQSLPLNFRRNPIQCTVSTKNGPAKSGSWGERTGCFEEYKEGGEAALCASLSVYHCRLRVDLWEAGKVLKQNGVPDWPFLATYLISEASSLESSRWSNYISALPRQPYSLLYWTREELDRYLEASQIRQRAIERVTNVVGTYNDLRLRIFSKYPALFPEEVFNIETFKWSFGILFSRLVRLPSLGGKVALVPWADMLNHSCEVDAFLDYDKSSQGVVFSTDVSYEPGEQVFISYGKKSNGELLLSYGFVPREGTNPRDSVELSLSISKSDKCYKEKLEALRKHGLSASQCYPIQVTGWPLELMAYAYLAVSPPSMSGQFEEMAAAASNKSTTKKDLRYSEIEEEALQFILDSCEVSISKYNKFLQASGSMDLDVTSPKQLNRSYAINFA